MASVTGAKALQALELGARRCRGSTRRLRGNRSRSRIVGRGSRVAAALSSAEPFINFQSKVFDVEELDVGTEKELVVRGGRDKFHLLPKALEGVKTVSVIGWGSQAPAQAQNMRESFQEAGMDTKVMIGLRRNSSSWQQAEEAGFKEGDGTLAEVFDAVSEGDLVLLLIADSAQAELYPRILAAMKSGATLGLSHGFLLGAMKNDAAEFRKDINVVGVCPKGMGASVRRLYEQGRSINGAGINSSFAVHQDATGNATDVALGWSVAIGSPVTFATTLEQEYTSDIFGERMVLLGGVHGMCEALYRRFVAEGMDKEEAFIHTAECVTGPISRVVSARGIKGLYNELDSDNERNEFLRAFSASYEPCLDLAHEAYEEVASGNEIRSVIMAGNRFHRFPMGKIDGTDMWRVGESARAKRDEESIPLNPTTAGVYAAMMVAQVDTLREKGHSFSEVCNESVIEAVDSLNPFMHARGVAFMVDNCSTTARLGARKWAPRFDYQLTQQSFVTLDSEEARDNELEQHFLNHPLHRALDTCAQMRPPVDISVTGSQVGKQLISG